THENPPEARRIHRAGLFVGEKLRLDEAAETPFGAARFLCVRDAVHERGHLLVHVELVVVQHETGDAIFLMQRDELVDDALNRSHARAPEHWRGAAAAEAAFERTPELGDEAERTVSVDGI